MVSVRPSGNTRQSPFSMLGTASARRGCNTPRSRGTTRPVFSRSPIWLMPAEVRPPATAELTRFTRLGGSLRNAAVTHLGEDCELGAAGREPGVSGRLGGAQLIATIASPIHSAPTRPHPIMAPSSDPAAKLLARRIVGVFYTRR